MTPEMDSECPSNYHSANLIRLAKLWYFSNKADRMRAEILDRQLAQLKGRHQDSTRRVTDLALWAYNKQKVNVTTDLPEHMDPVFQSYANTNIRGFIFAGYTLSFELSVSHFTNSLEHN